MNGTPSTTPNSDIVQKMQGAFVLTVACLGFVALRCEAAVQADLLSPPLVGIMPAPRHRASTTPPAAAKPVRATSVLRGPTYFPALQEFNSHAMRRLQTGNGTNRPFRLKGR